MLLDVGRLRHSLVRGLGRRGSGLSPGRRGIRHWLCILAAGLLAGAAAGVALSGWPAIGVPRGVLLREARDRLADQLSALFADQAALGRLIGGIARDHRLEWMAQVSRDDPRIWNMVISDQHGRILGQARPMVPVPASLGALVVPIDKRANGQLVRGAPVLVRSADLGRAPMLIGVTSVLGKQDAGDPVMITVLTRIADLPRAGRSIGASLLITDDGVLLSDAGNIRSLGDKLRPPAGLPDAPARSVVVRLEDGDHRFMVRRLGAWPVSLVLNAGLVAWPRLLIASALPAALVLSSALLLLLGQPPGTQRAGASGSIPDAGLVPSPARDDGSSIHLTSRRVAAGLAHEVNNLLTMLSLDAELVGVLHPQDDELAALSRSMLDAAARGATLTQTLLAYSERLVLQPRLLDLDVLVLANMALFKSRLLAGQHLTVIRSGEGHLVSVDDSACVACIAALVRNAAEASDPHGEIRIEIGLLDGGAMLVVDDAGPGMAPAILERAMHPGFTTRHDGRHLGMGLAAARGFVRQSGGVLRLESGPGLGTRAVIVLPLEPQSAMIGRAEPMPPVGAAPTISTVGRIMTVLLVDDSEPVRTSIARHLRLDGYKVIEAGDALRALSLMGRGVDVLVADIVLDGTTDGWALAAQARAQDPTLPLVFLSGFMTTRQPDLLAGDDLASFVRKPVTGAELTAVIAGLLALRETRRSPAPRRLT